LSVKKEMYILQILVSDISIVRSPPGDTEYFLLIEISI